MGHKYVNKIITMTVKVSVTIVLRTNLPIWHPSFREIIRGRVSQTAFIPGHAPLLG